ncbi:MAG TPA: ABC transporter substrate-binding protein [Flexivirga sp.]|uniref:ABC transporter substrate-binding protein n=1 Tax=Flexivirga sp. TaxID=1962927 RepID=UPI002B5A7A65|nr:ABC transporter substrate-binding protein [Flexivirga sp.]HWC23891.1 ABC transporter substrate-binding protein [Flexivirga sp.]
MRRASNRRWIGVGIVMSAAVGLAACGGSGAGGKGAAGGGSGDTIRIGVGIDAAYAPFFLADTDGMFKDAGLNVKLVQFGRGGDAVQAIAGDQVEMAGNSDTTTLTLLKQNPDLRAMFIYEQSGKYLKVVAKPGITKASQIKKMGVTQGLSDYMAQKYFEANKVPLDSVKFVESDPSSLPALTKKGTVDAYLLWEPWPSNGVKLGLKELTDTGSYGYSYVHWAVADSTWLKGHEKEAAKVAKVLDKASKITAKDPDRAAVAVQAEAKIKKADAKQAIELVDWKVRDFNGKDMTSYQDQIKYFVKKGTLNKALDIKPNILNGWYDEHVAKP